jgi:hypothetical protein
VGVSSALGYLHLGQVARVKLPPHLMEQTVTDTHGKEEARAGALHQSCVTHICLVTWLLGHHGCAGQVRALPVPTQQMALAMATV